MNSATSPARPPRRVLIMLVILTLVWGTNWSLFPLAVREISVWTFRAIAVFFCGAVLLVLAKLRGQSLAVPRASSQELAAVGVVRIRPRSGVATAG